MWVDLIQSFESVKSKILKFPREEEILLQDDAIEILPG